MTTSERDRSGQPSEGQQPFAGGLNAPLDQQRPPEAARLPPDDYRHRLQGRLPEQWKPLRSRDMTPEELRNLGHTMYVVAFGVGIYSFLVDQVNQRYGPEPASDPEGLFDPTSLPAMLYIEAFARTCGLNETLLRRWGTLASMELARASLPRLKTERRKLVGDDVPPVSWSAAMAAIKEHPLFPTDYHGGTWPPANLSPAIDTSLERVAALDEVIAAAAAIATGGLRASIAQHSWFVLDAQRSGIAPRIGRL